MKPIVSAKSTRHMSRFLLLLSATLALSSTAQAVDKNTEESVVSANPTLVGRWTGVGSFLDVKLDKEIGKVPLEVEIRADGTVSGCIGDAKLTQTSIEKARYGFEIHAILDSKIRRDKAETKNHLIVLLVSPVKDKEGALVSKANFHLKSRYGFDFTYRVGGVMLKRQP